MRRLSIRSRRARRSGGDLLRAGLVGGAICVVGQALVNLYEHWGASATVAATWCLITLVFSARC